MLRPYNVEIDGTFFFFLTTKGNRNIITLIDETSRWRRYCQFDIDFYDFAVFPEPDPPKSKQYDPRVGHTLVDFIISRIQSNTSAAITFITANSDGRCEQRSKHFERLITQHCPDYIDFNVISIDQDGQELRAYMLYHAHNQHSGYILQAFVNYYEENYS